MTLQTALLQATRILETAGIAVPRLTAEVLLSHACHCSRPYLYAHSDRELKEVEWIHYGRYLHERLGGKPTQYITGHQEFYGRDFLVNSSVLIPRPETEHLVELAISRVEPGWRVVDAGCGSGAIAISVALERNIRVYGCDISLPALKLARRNAWKMSAPVDFLASDLLSAFSAESLDAVLSNPPYVPLRAREGLQREVRDFEPAVALFGGPDGNEIYARLVAQSAVTLKPGGWLMMELGFGSLDAVLQMTQTGWQDVAVTDDLAGIPRVLSARRI